MLDFLDLPERHSGGRMQAGLLHNLRMFLMATVSPLSARRRVQVTPASAPPICTPVEGSLIRKVREEGDEPLALLRREPGQWAGVYTVHNIFASDSLQIHHRRSQIAVPQPELQGPYIADRFLQIPRREGVAEFMKKIFEQ